MMLWFIAKYINDWSVNEIEIVILPQFINYFFVILMQLL